MTDDYVMVPITKIENKTWLLLKVISKSWNIRSASMDKKPHQEKDPSDHRVFEIGAEGSVKCTPKSQWDIESYNPNA
jgi:hypothetical protein